MLYIPLDVLGVFLTLLRWIVLIVRNFHWIAARPVSRVGGSSVALGLLAPPEKERNTGKRK